MQDYPLIKDRIALDLERIEVQINRLWDEMSPNDREHYGRLTGNIPWRTCEETWSVIGDCYLRCGAPAVMFVKHRGRREGPYQMCREHGTHNVQHRDAELLCERGE